MKKLFLALACAAALAPLAPAAAEESKMKMSEALAALAALRSLDGHQVVIKTGNGDQVMNAPWEFKNGALRLAIAADISILSGVEKNVDVARQLIIKEVTKNAPGVEIQAGTPEMAEFLRQFSDLLDRPATSADGVIMLDAKDFRLDVNEIPGSTLAAIKPLLK